MSYEYTFLNTASDDAKEFMKREFHEDHFDKTGIKTKKYTLQVKNNNEIIAIAKGAIFDTTLFISEFIVAIAHRKNGIGKELIKQIEDYAKNKGCKNMWVDTYEYQAPEFYLKNGFIEIERIENYRGEHARIFFEKKI